MNPVKIKYRWCAYFIVAMVACNSGSNSNNAPADTTQLHKDSIPVIDKKNDVIKSETDIFDTMNTLPFIKESNRHIDSISKHKHSIAYIVDTTVTEYSVTAGFNGELRFETYYNFTIDKKTKAIKVMDIISGDMVTVEEFEKLHPSKK